MLIIAVGLLIYKLATEDLISPYVALGVVVVAGVITAVVILVRKKK